MREQDKVLVQPPVALARDNLKMPRELNNLYIIF
jgi:hypothetical protein